MANFSASQGVKHRGDSNMITKATGIAGFLFMALALSMTLYSKNTQLRVEEKSSIVIASNSTDKDSANKENGDQKDTNGQKEKK